MPFLIERRQVLLKLEAVPGTAETIAAADNLPRTRNIKISPASLQVDRPTNRATLTNFPKLSPGQITHEVTFQVEMGGLPGNPQTTFAEPNWSKALRACAFTHQGARELTIGAITGGPFRHGELVTQTTSNATGTVVGDTFTPTPALFLTVVSGSFTTTAGHILTGGTSGATTAAPSVVSANTYNTWKLTSDVLGMASATIEARVDGKILKLRGCRGTVEWQMQHGDIVLMSFTFRGSQVSYIDGAVFTTGLQDSQFTPPAFFNPTFTLSDGTVTAASGNITTINYALNNAIVNRENSISTSGDGIDQIYITDRAPTGSFNPEEVINTVYNFMAAYKSGLAQRLRLIVGGTSGNRFHFLTPGLLFTGLGDADRDGIMNWDGSFDITGGEYGSGLAGSDNEIVVIGN